MTLSGQIVDVVAGRIFPGQISFSNGKTDRIQELAEAPDRFIIPGLVDAHVHVESSMLTPTEFARLAVVHGTVATVSDPHEIANVLGLDGVKYMLENARKTPFHFYFGAPSCVPATSFETAGAHLGPEEVQELLEMEQIHYLSEMMNYPGVLNQDEEVMAKLKIARELGKPVDGHAPGLKGEDAKRYAAAGISTDHECFTAEEALDKLAAGMKILIREGSAAKNFEALIGLMHEHSEQMMFCSDDKHPNDLRDGHINRLVARAIAKGVEPMKALRAATLNPVRHYNLHCGLLQQGDPATFAIVDSLKEMNVQETWLQSEKVAEAGETLLPHQPAAAPNQFRCPPLQPEQLEVPVQPGKQLRVIRALDGQLITREEHVQPLVRQGLAIPDRQQDILKIVVYNRYEKAPPAISFITGFGLNRGAIASSVAHDSHNVIAVGTTDEAIAKAINLLVEAKGGISLALADEEVYEDGVQELVLPLPVAGLMSTGDGYEVARLYEELDREAKALGSQLTAPYMTLSFMALLVIPQLKLSDKGLFDGASFQFAKLWY